jgi:putative phosphoesterase
MSRLAIISDLHADVHALRAALAQIKRLGCHTVVCAGDVVDYGAYPDETISLLIDRKIPTIRGNHDRYAALESRNDRTSGLSNKAIRFLRRLPVSWNARIEDVRVAVHHGRPGNDVHGVYPDITQAGATALLDAASCEVLVVGHTHVAFERYVSGGRLVCNPGALLRDPAQHAEVPAHGTFGVLELPSCTFSVHAAATGEVVPHLRGHQNVRHEELEHPRRPAPATASYEMGIGNSSL